MMKESVRKLTVCAVLAFMLSGILSQNIFGAVSEGNMSAITGGNCLYRPVTSDREKTPDDWETIGIEGFSKGAVENTAIALDNNNIPYVVYSDAKNHGKVTVKKYDGDKWNTVGTEGFSTKGVKDASIVIDKNNTPYVVYIEDVNGKIVVSKFVDGKWINVGGNAGFGDEASIALDSNGTPYVAYTYSVKNKALGMKKLYGAVVSKYVNKKWEVEFSTGSLKLFDYYTYPAVALDSSDTPYVAFNHNGINVIKVSDSTTASAKKTIDNYCIKNDDKFITMAIDSKSNVYVAYQEGSSEKAVVRKYTNDKGLDLNDSWNVSKGKAAYTSIALDSFDTPYVVYMDYKNGKAEVNKYEDGKWSSVGNKGMSKGKAKYTSIAIDGDGNPFVVYQDGTKCNKATVSKYAKEFVITFDSNGGTEIQKQYVAYNGRIQIPAEPEKEGYIFENWYQDKDLTEVFDFSTPVTKDITLFSKYLVTVPTADLTVNIEGNGSVVDWIYGSTKSFEVGTSVTLNAVADKDSIFVYWMDKSERILSTNAKYAIEIGSNETLTATFLDKEQKLVTFKNGNGEIIKTDSLIEGKDVVFPKEPSILGYKFIGWDKTADEIKTAAGNVVVTAKYEELKETVSISVYGGTGSGEYDLMDYISVIADEPEDGQKFAYWVDEKANKLCYDNVYKFYATRPVVLTAVYVPDFETIEMEASISITSIIKTEEKINFVAERIIPEGNTVISHGIIATNNSSTGASEEGFVLDGTDVLKATAKTKGLLGTFVLYKSSALNETWYARGYVIYKDSEGKVFTIYSNIVQETID